MGVSPGSPVSASNTNNAFLDANGDDTGLGKITLANTDAISGAQVDNLQREHNAASSFTGMPLNSVKDVIPAWTSNDVGTSSDSLKTRTDLLSAKFNNSTGHAHSGSPGDGALIDGGNIQNVPLQGVYKMGVDITGATGSSSDVSADFTSAVPSSTPFTKGVVANSPYNMCFIRQASGTNENDTYTDGSGNVVYGRLTEASGVWTLSYYVLISGTETAYSFGSASDVRYYYQQLFSRIVDAPVYSDLSNIPSDNATADVVDATETQAGKVALANAVAEPVGTANVKGVSSRAAKMDHAHEGVHSLGVDGDATKLLGDIDLQAGDNMVITRTGQKLRLDASVGAVGYQEALGVGNGSQTTFGPLANTPSSAQSVAVFVDGLKANVADWSLSGSSVVFGTAPEVGQNVEVYYIANGTPPPPPTVTGVLKQEVRTITSLEASNKKLTLAQTPASPSDVMLDVVSGGPQAFNVDYTVVSNELRWNGYALDGVLSQSDVLRIVYVY